MGWTNPATWTVGELVLASKMNTHVRDNLNAVGPIVKVRKIADESVTSSIAMQDDNHLLFAIAASETWSVEFTLFVTGVTTGDIAIAVGVPSGATGFIGVQGPEIASTSITSTLGSVQAFSGLGDGSTITMGLSAGFSLLRVYADVVNSTTAGNVTLRWAQRVSDATATTIKAGSWLRGTRMSP